MLFRIVFCFCILFFVSIYPASAKTLQCIYTGQMNYLPFIPPAKFSPFSSFVYPIDGTNLFVVLDDVNKSVEILDGTENKHMANVLRYNNNEILFEYEMDSPFEEKKFEHEKNNKSNKMKMAWHINRLTGRFEHQIYDKPFFGENFVARMTKNSGICHLYTEPLPNIIAPKPKF